METAKAIPLPVPGLMTPANAPTLPADDLPPWLQEGPARPRERAAALPEPPRSRAGGEELHWGVVALTLVTALCVLAGSRADAASQPRELLPVMIAAPGR